MKNDANLHALDICISFSSSNNQFSEFRISISPIQGVAKCFNLFNVKSYFGIFECVVTLILNFYLVKIIKK